MNKPKTVTILAAVFGVAFVFLIFRTKSRVENLNLTNSNEAVTAVDEAPKKSIVLESDSEFTRLAVNTKISEENTKWQLAEKRLNMKGTSLPKRGGEVLLNVELKKSPSCTPGDADAIEMDLKSAPENQLLVTLESMSRGPKSFYWEVPREFSTQGSANKTFQISVKREPLQFGLYVCTARLGTKSCQEKKVRDVNEIFTEHFTKKANAGKEERVIFYQYLLIDDRGLSAFQESARGEQQFNELKGYARERKFQGDNVEAGIDSAKNNLETLLSLPVAFEKNKIVVELPKYDAMACAQIKRKKRN